MRSRYGYGYQLTSCRATIEHSTPRPVPDSVDRSDGVDVEPAAIFRWYWVRELCIVDPALRVERRHGDGIDDINAIAVDVRMDVNDVQSEGRHPPQNDRGVMDGELQ